MVEEDEKDGELRVVHASEIIEKIHKGEPIEYDHVIIKGNLDLLDLAGEYRRLRIPDEPYFGPEKDFCVKSNINIINSTIDGELYFHNAILSRSVSFRNTKFCKGAFFAIFSDNADFSGVQFSDEANFREAKFEQDANFNKAYFKKVSFWKCEFNGRTSFEYATINGADFIGGRFKDSANFKKAKLVHADFRGSKFEDLTDFDEISFKGKTCFKYAKFESWVSFNRAIFSENAVFEKVNFDEGVEFYGTQFNGEILTFRDAKFGYPRSQEDACRKAKRLLEAQGNRKEAEYHFYREMEAIRMQKPPYIRLLEFVLIQKIFGYGVHPWWLMGWWLVIIALFTGLYYIGGGISGTSGLFDYLKVSFATAIAPGYIAVIINPGTSTGYKITTEYYQALAMIETIVGTFLWAGFIATFAKKYMR